MRSSGGFLARAPADPGGSGGSVGSARAQPRSPHPRPPDVLPARTRPVRPKMARRAARLARTARAGVGHARSGCIKAVLDAVLELRPSTPVVRFAELGHYPQMRSRTRSPGPSRASRTRRHERGYFGGATRTSSAARTLHRAARSRGRDHRRRPPPYLRASGERLNVPPPSPPPRDPEPSARCPSAATVPTSSLSCSR